MRGVPPGLHQWVTDIITSPQPWADADTRAALVRMLLRGTTTDSGCHVVGDPTRYAPFHVPGYRSGNMHGHRAIFQAIHGELPEGLVVRHSCDTKNCVNPDHLSSGTPSDNTEDAYERNRIPRNQARGEAAGSAVLTEMQVVEIRKRAKAGETFKSIAADLGRPYSPVRAAGVGETWQHVEEPPAPKTERGKTRNPRLLERGSLKPQVVQMWLDGMSARQIREATGVSRTTTCRWTKGLRRSDIRRAS